VKTVIILLILACESITAYSQSKPITYGFRNFVFGSSISSFPTQKLVFQSQGSDENFKRYTIKEDDMLVLGWPADKIEYCFCNGKYMETIITVTGESQITAVIQKVEDKYGQPETLYDADGSPHIFNGFILSKWEDGRVRIEASYNPDKLILAIAEKKLQDGCLGIVHKKDDF